MRRSWARCRRAARHALRVGLLGLALAALALSAQTAQAERRVALVIGNAFYGASSLKNPRNDAALMARTLAATGFDVMTVMDANIDDMHAAVRLFGERLQAPETVALFYYAGHGVQAEDENYLIPAGSDLGAIPDMAASSLPLREVLGVMASAEPLANIVILDACRDNPFIGPLRSPVPAGLAQAVAPASTLIAYATAPGQIARDGDGGNSPYTQALAANMLTPGTDLDDVFRATRLAVRRATANRQTPWEHSSLTDEFIFQPVSGALATTSDEGRSASNDVRLSEVEAWDRIKASNDPEAFKEHLRKFPEGLFAELAAVRIARLEQLRQQTPWNWIMTGHIDQTVAASAAAAVAYEKAARIDTAAASAADLASAATLYMEAAQAGHGQAMTALARSYAQGRGLTQQPEEALRWYEKAVEANEPAAMTALGQLYEFGTSVPQNLAEAARLYRMAADGGDAEGATSLAYLFQQGKGVAKDGAEARRHYRQAADKGQSRAMFNLALMLAQGEGGSADRAQSVQLLEKAAALGHVRSMRELAIVYDRGRGVRYDAQRAADFYLAALAASRAAEQAAQLEGEFAAWSFATRRSIQRNLAAKGLYRGLLLGRLDSATRQGLQAYAAVARSAATSAGPVAAAGAGGPVLP